ncbi:MAG: ATP-binding protein [Chloroflexota bacterium]|nr:ATP-binding protein [Chloroflexota bacterium]
MHRPPTSEIAMLPPLPASDNRPSLADRVAAARRRRFVGRVEERSWLEGALASADPPFAVLFVHGPGGIGKTMLLGEYRRIAEETGYRTITIDGHACEPSPPGFLGAVARVLGPTDPAGCMAALARQDRLALLIDTYEMLQPLDGWLRNDFLPRLPASAVTVVAGRNAPDPRWRTSPGWADLVEVQALRNLNPAESRTYLASRGVPDDSHDSVLGFTHGHPLALSLAGDVATRSQAPFEPSQQPDVIAALLEHLIEHVPSPLHRQALELCSHARVTTESLLARVFGDDQAYTLFTWLHGLSFMEHGQGGIFPHDLARDVLSANLRWRHPERFREVHQQVHDYHVDRIRSTQGREQFHELYNLMFLHRDNPSWQQFAQTDRYGHEYLEPATEREHETILEMIGHHEGRESAEVAAEWLRLQPEAFKVLRDLHGEITGMVALPMLDHYSQEDVGFDPIVLGALDLMKQHGPLLPGQEAFCLRWCMGREAYRTDATRTHFAMTAAPYPYTRPNLAWGIFPVPDLEYWRPIFEYLCFRHYPGAETRFAGRSWSYFGTNLLEMPIEAMDRVLTEREISLSPVLEPPVRGTVPALAVLSETDFRQAVRQALRDYHRADALTANPLSHSRLVMARSGGDPVEAMRSLLREATEGIDTGPRMRKLRDALYHTFIEPSRTQAAAAEVLNLPFSTYRRHLATAIDTATGELWRQELAAGTPQPR